MYRSGAQQGRYKERTNTSILHLYLEVFLIARVEVEHEELQEAKY